MKPRLKIVSPDAPPNDELAFEIEAINLLNQAMSGRYELAKSALRGLVRRCYNRGRMRDKGGDCASTAKEHRTAAGAS